MDKRDMPDEVSARSLERSAKRGNERVRFAAFYGEWIRENTSATMAEARAAYAAQEAK